MSKNFQITPSGVACNLSCTYCYQHDLRDAGNFGNESMDWEAMKKVLDEEADSVNVFGGEALLTPLEDLEKILKYGYEKFGRAAVQTNGTLISDEHIELFKKYNVHVGFSFDGWGKLNDLRWAGTLKKTRKNTKKTFHNIEKVLKNGLTAGVIITLHKVNVGTPERYESFKEMLKWLQDIGVTSIKLHDLEVDTDLTARKHILDMDYQKEIFLDLAKYRKEVPALQISIFKDIKNLLLADESSANCVWRACDPYTTKAVNALRPDGSVGACEMTNKDGVPWIKGEEAGYERYVALYQTPQENNGCQGCRFWSMCRGQCPGDSLNGDWRNKSDTCELWKTLFEHFEEEIEATGVTPLSLHPQREKVESIMLDGWKNKKNISINEALIRAKNNP